MNKTKIEWTDYTWNPVTGCKHGCHYCYARRLAMRFEGHFNPVIHLDRFDQPSKIKKPSKVFICSMADLFGEWVDAQWIWQIIMTVKKNPQHTFQFLTKNPQRYLDFRFPDNVQLGCTIDKIKTETNTEVNIMRTLSLSHYTFISFEPLLGDMSQLFRDSTGECMKSVNLVIVGAMSGPGAIKPKKEWVDSIKHHNIFYKNNLSKKLYE